MSLERSGYTKAKYNKKTYLIYSEINYEDYTIELLGADNNPFTVKICYVELLKEIKE